MDSTAQSGPDTALARDTEFNTPNYTDSVLGDFCPVISSEPSWTSTEHPRQPSTMVTWTTGYGTLNARKLHHAASYNNYTVLLQSSSFTITKVYTGDSPSPSARPTITMSSTSTRSTNGIQTWNLILPTSGLAPPVRPTQSKSHRTALHMSPSTTCSYRCKRTTTTVASSCWHTNVPCNHGSAHTY
jgi:hypothetical protein